MLLDLVVCGGMARCCVIADDEDESWSWGACAKLVVCTLVRRVGSLSACEWGGMLAGYISVYRHGPKSGEIYIMGPGLVGLWWAFGPIRLLDLRWRFSAAVPHADVRPRHMC